ETEPGPARRSAGNRCTDGRACCRRGARRHRGRGRIVAHHESQESGRSGRSLWTIRHRYPLSRSGGEAIHSMTDILTVMLVAGEPSGDQIGAQLMSGIREIAGDGVRIVGSGGPAMAAQGLDSLFPFGVAAVMGLREVVPSIPKILRAVRTAKD